LGVAALEDKIAQQAVVTTFLVEAGGDSVSFLEGNE
jgi:hypothetical protein